MTRCVQPPYLIADSRLLFASEGKESLLRSACESIANERPRAAYIGTANGDLPEYYSIFLSALAAIGIEDCSMISSSYHHVDRANLQEADLVLLAGGDVALGWQVMEETGLHEGIRGRFFAGAVLVRVSAGAILMGVRGCSAEDTRKGRTIDALSLVPYAIDVHDEANEWRRLWKVLSVLDPHVHGLGLPFGSGVTFHPDSSVEPLRRPIAEFWVEGDQIVQTLLVPEEP